MKSVLHNLPADQLAIALGITELQEAARLVDADIDNVKPWIVDYAWNLHGRELLKMSGIRKLLIDTLGDEWIEGQASDNNISSLLSKRFDLVHALSLLPWKPNSRFSLQLVKALGLGSEFLPVRHSASNLTQEIVEPYELLPTLHDYQAELKKKIVSNLQTRVSSFLVQMPTGSGKTRTMMESLVDYSIKSELLRDGYNLVWLAHTEELCEQAIDSIKDVWAVHGDMSLRILRMWGGHKFNPIEACGSLIVGTYQTLASHKKHKNDLLLHLQNTAKIIVVDEAHKALAPTYESSLNTLREKGAVLVGLTATPGRGLEVDSENRKLARLFERRLVSPSFDGNAIEILRDTGVLAKLERVVVETGINFDVSTSDQDDIVERSDFSHHFINRLASNSERNRLILSQIESEVKAGNPTIVFSCNNAHSRLLSAALAIKGVNSGYVDCTTPRGARRSVIERFKSGKLDVILNYGVLSTGFDAPRIKSVMITRPTASVVLYSQMVGRGLRGSKMGGNDSCRLLDVRDNFLNFGVVDNVYDCFEEFWS